MRKQNWVLSAVIFLAVSCFWAAPAFSYLSEIKFLTKEEIVKLEDEALVDTYIDTLVELEATRTFHLTSGFAPKEYVDYKALLKYRYQLLMEIHKRNLEVPQYDINSQFTRY